MILYLPALLACTARAPIDSAGPVDSDTAAQPVEWQPGDPIPGWPSGECAIPEEVIADGYEVEWPLEVNAQLLHSTEGDPAVMAGFSRNTCGPANPSCDNTDGWGEEFRFTAVLLLAGLGETLNFRGENCPTFGEVPYVAAFLADYAPAGSAGGDIQVNDQCDTSWIGVPFYACLSELRPDRTAGAAWFKVGASNGFRGVSYYYAQFDGLHVPGHAFYDREAARLELSAAEFAYSSSYQVPYDHAWPWDSITDDAVRQRVYDLYAPVDPENEPELPEE